MFNLPWWVRWTFDLGLFVVPYWLLCSNDLLKFSKLTIFD